MDSVATTYTAPVKTEGRSDFAVTGRRVIATMIDSVLLGSAYTILVALFGNYTHPRAWEWNGTLPGLTANLFYALGVFLYFVVLEGYCGQTLGKMVAGIKVVQEGTQSTPGYGAATIRTVLRLVDGLFAYLVAFIVVLSSEKRQRLGDMAASTLVIRK
jgi:uncharacterized RDD family membrane protein YckC